MNPTLRSDGEHRDRSGHLFWGRVRTSTFVLLLAFFGTAWLYETYKPPEQPAQSTQVVPPGFVPDPAYTWVPRTKVWTTTPTTTRPPVTTTTTPEPTTPTETPTTTLPGETTGPAPTPTTEPAPAPATPPTTLAPGQAPQTTAENRSGTPAATVPGATPAPGPATVPTTARGPG